VYLFSVIRSVAWERYSTRAASRGQGTGGGAALQHTCTHLAELPHTDPPPETFINTYAYRCLCAVLTGLLQQREHGARGPVGDGRLALQLVFPHRVAGRDLVHGPDQNQAGLVRELEDLLGLPLVELLPDIEF